MDCLDVCTSFCISWFWLKNKFFSMKNQNNYLSTFLSHSSFVETFLLVFEETDVCLIDNFPLFKPWKPTARNTCKLGRNYKNMGRPKTILLYSFSFPSLSFSLSFIEPLDSFCLFFIHSVFHSLYISLCFFHSLCLSFSPSFILSVSHSRLRL